MLGFLKHCKKKSLQIPYCIFFFSFQGFSLSQILRGKLKKQLLAFLCKLVLNYFLNAQNIDLKALDFSEA